MLIKDVFLHENKKAIYISLDGMNFPDKISVAIIQGKRYNILKYDKMVAISGRFSLVVLLDTEDELEIGQEIIIE